MSKISISRQIMAPKDYVFQTISDIQNLAKAVPDIVDVQFLTDQKYGVGTQFREIRIMNGKKAMTVQNVTELEVNSHIRLVSNAGGTIWDSVFSVQDDGDNTMLSLEMEYKPYKIMAKIITPFMKRMMIKALEKDMDSVKKYCEKERQQF